MAAFTLSRTPVGRVPRPQQADRHDHDRKPAAWRREEVEQLITFPLWKRQMNGLPGSERCARRQRRPVVRLRHLRLEHGHFRARQMVSERRRHGGGLPSGVMPRMGPISSIMGEIMQIAIRSIRQDLADAGARIR